MNIYEILEEFEQAYPESVFPELTDEERAHMISTHRGVMDRVSASMGRHLVKMIRRKLADEEGERLQKTTRDLLSYYDKYGAQQFNRHFGTKDVPGARFVEFLREFLAEGDPSNHPDVG